MKIRGRRIGRRNTLIRIRAYLLGFRFLCLMHWGIKFRIAAARFRGSEFVELGTAQQNVSCEPWTK